MSGRQSTFDVVGPFGSPDGSRAELDDMLVDFVEFDGDPGFGGLATRADDSKVRVIAGKLGSGKTVYMRRLQDYQAHQDSVYAHLPEHDPPKTEVVVTACQWFTGQVLVEKWMQIWERAIIRSLASHLLLHRELQAPGQRRAPGGDPARLRPAARRGAPAPGHLRRAQQHRPRAAHRPPALQLPRRPAVGGPQGPARRGARAHQAGLLLPGRGRRGVRPRPDVLAEVPGGALLPGHAAAAGPAPGRPAARGGEHPGHRHVLRAPLRARPPLPERAAHPAAQLGRGVAAAPAAAEAGAAAPDVADAAPVQRHDGPATGSASPR